MAVYSTCNNKSTNEEDKDRQSYIFYYLCIHSFIHWHKLPHIFLQLFKVHCIDSPFGICVATCSLNLFVHALYCNHHRRRMIERQTSFLLLFDLILKMKLILTGT